MTIYSKDQASRRGFLQAGLGMATAAATAAAVAASGSAQAQTKIAPAMVQYQDMPKNGQHCSICAQWEAPNACKLISGEIKPDGWCAIYAPKA